jgi:L-arabinose isomerase
LSSARTACPRTSSSSVASLTTEHLQDFADMADIEFLWIGKDTQARQFRNELRWNAAAYR